ncbi:aminotransferase class I and II domain-containing protein [Ditylenchus destructor]|nr:aminotransferase class I and II domain-containing protein [Ditylenchus destructor]
MNRSPWTQARRAARMNPSIIREILKVTEKPGILSMAGGLPSADTFPVEAIKAACDRVLTNNAKEALQYAASEGFAPLREWVANKVASLGIKAHPDQVLITSGSQQGLDLVGKLLCDAGAPVAVETPTYLGALQAFTPYEPIFASLASDDQGPLPSAIAALPHDAPGTRFAYLLPNYQNPTGRVMSRERREAVMAAAARPTCRSSRTTPTATCGQAGGRPAHAGLQPARGARGHQGRLPGRARAQDPRPLQGQPRCDGRRAARLPARRLRMQKPEGGMFFWIRLPEGLDAMALLPRAVDAGIAYVPGAAFYAHQPDPRTLRLSFVTLTPDLITEGVEKLGRMLHEALAQTAETTP